MVLEKMGAIRRKRMMPVCSASTDQFTSPKTGAVGVERFKLDAVPGTYWGASQAVEERVTLWLDTGTEVVQASAQVGENLLRVAEAAGAMVPDEDFCFEGTCSNCEMEVEGGAQEVGYRAEPGSLDVVRACLCPVPGGQPERTIKMLNEADIWGDGVL
ncbi:hypothetical protein KFL_004500020 [Klebsormidium nitens]|uniref:2Fe-2S ferredoxin-type domain-containing protein n=1 Tax=Klebsormidium nitens TaxID=105231 RepID=A0A1Y1IF73_KLENI|nr:hypothetical protein KFL_004500020 [Klebsormidium nitens]|eukprot:GAQ88662.1 hypothetical protein KFL_004500020 [Klebsormidium nitens]